MLSRVFFFFNDTATTEIYTLSLHDALPISCCSRRQGANTAPRCISPAARRTSDRKSTRLNSSHLVISYAVFCLKKKMKDHYTRAQWLAEGSTSTFATYTMETPHFSSKQQVY